MATLVLTAVGTIVGGPIGAFVGAAIGSQIDQRLFAPKGRQGPRLGDLSVQVSRYGQPIPKLFGTMRVAGTVIWATDLIEDSHKSGGGKGKPKTTTYSYSASFAVVLSARPIRAVHRIWADGKLLRGAAGDWKAHTRFRLYPGGEDQPVDPLLAAAEGVTDTPAYRGLAYAVFEHLELEDFANHIPLLTFEVEADDGDVALHDIAAELSDGAIAGYAPTTLHGFAAGGDSVRGAIDTLGRAAGLRYRDDGQYLRITADDAVARAIDDDALGCTADGKPGPRIAGERTAASMLPDEIALSYYEPQRDYQAGLQRARRGGPGRRSEQVELAVALTAEGAKALAEQRLAAAWSERVKRTAKLPWRLLDLQPGDVVTLPDVAGRWRIDAIQCEKMVVEARLTGIAPGVGDFVPPAQPGRPVGSGDAVHGPTVLHVLDLPLLDDMALTAPRLFIAAAGSQPGWRRAALLGSADGGATYQELGATAAPATIGVATSVLAAGSALLFDTRNSVEVELLHDAMTLEGRSDDALMGGANLALVGDELIQFGAVEQIGARTCRLSHLTRGRRGTEWAIAGHGVGERFVVIEADSLLAYDVPLGVMGGTVSVVAAGISDTTGVEATAIVKGQALRPPAPVDLRATRLGDGTIRITWTRRSRTGWAWLEGDAPLGEESEHYRLEIMPSTGSPRAVSVSTPHYDYTLAEQAMDGAAGTTALTIAVAQLGSIAATMPPASTTITL